MAYTITDPALPGAVRNLSVDEIVNGVVVDWDPPDRFAGDSATNPDFGPIDVAYYEVYLLKSDGITTATYPAGHPTRAGQPVQDLQVVSTKKRFKVKASDGSWSIAGGPFKAKVIPIGHSGPVQSGGTPGSSPGSSAGGTITTGSVGSDGAAPSSSPTPTVLGGPTFLYAKWSPITNPDPVTYEVHMSTASGFTPGAGTKLADVTGTGFIIKQTAAGAALNYGTTYYVKTVAKDVDGSASASAQGSAQMAQLQGGGGSGDILAGTIIGNDIAAATVTADRLNVSTLSAITANMGTVTAGTLQTGTSGTYLKISSTNADRIEFFQAGSLNGTIQSTTQGVFLYNSGGTYMFAAFNTGPAVVQSSNGLHSFQATTGGVIVGGGSSLLGFFGSGGATQRADPGNAAQTLADLQAKVNGILGILRAYNLIV